MTDKLYAATIWRLAHTCPAYCPCRRLNERGETPRNPEVCPYEQAACQ